MKLKPGDTIGILGGGQLGRMLAMAAARLGLRCQVFSPDLDLARLRRGAERDLRRICRRRGAGIVPANDVDVITYEFENVPAATAMVLAARRPVLPAQKILETTQDRLIEKDFVKRLGIGTADYADVSSVETLQAAISASASSPCIKISAASAMTARARRSSARATTPLKSGKISAPNPRSSKPSFPSSARSP